ncbi:hypothetical protein BKA69DRAFT_1102155 [Paraphysoderma sedebokerense]|nr:hypothetical protein BKA69DRAFT_1102155 [Paraphysoderma sedebokerense]
MQPAYLTITNSPTSPILYGYDSLPNIHSEINSKNTVHSLMYLIGRNYSDPYVQEIRKSASFKIENIGEKPVIVFNDVKLPKSFAKNLKWVKKLKQFWDIYRPKKNEKKEIDRLHVDQLMILMMGEYLSKASSTLGRRIGKVFFTVPYSYWPAREEAIRRIFDILGVDIYRFTYTDFVAAQSLALDKSTDCTQSVRDILQVKWGGSSLFTVILRQTPGNFFEVLKTERWWMGGDDITKAIVGSLKSSLGFKGKVDNKLMSVLWEEAENIKRYFEVPSRSTYEVSIKLDKTNVNARHSLSAPAFASLVEPFVSRAISQLSKLLQSSSNITITDVIFAGGSSHIRQFQSKLIENLRTQNVYPDYHIDTVSNPHEVILYGAGMNVFEQYGPCGCGTRNPTLAACMISRMAVNGMVEGIKGNDAWLFADQTYQIGTKAVINLKKSSISLSVYEARDVQSSKLSYRGNLFLSLPQDSPHSNKYLVKFLTSRLSTEVIVASYDDPKKKISKQIPKSQDFKKLARIFSKRGMLFDKKQVQSRFGSVGDWNVQGTLNVKSLNILQTDVVIIMTPFMVEKKWW